ncbi:conserved protein of unknown function [Acidithiobacillus ferrivorans]|uniref:Uncharacterized protein n=1 Tax=Acidithiobacillus ferrivorans TaxID=160808 RepID=A0A060UKB7_9PROT|nr:conserved hypothetical protein [Acidithiobacillus ferrivorans]SMH67021.1 conserved protein of unknown function [Acidithiobacillus ferrivorans]
MRLWDLYWVRTPMRRMPELRQLERQKSMMRNLPPKGTAGLARQSVNGPRRLPRPPASTRARVFLVRLLTKRGELATPRLPSSDITLSLILAWNKPSCSIGEIVEVPTFKVLNFSGGSKDSVQEKLRVGWSSAALQMCYAQKGRKYGGDTARTGSPRMAGRGGCSDGNAEA